MEQNKVQIIKLCYQPKKNWKRSAIKVQQILKTFVRNATFGFL